MHKEVLRTIKFTLFSASAGIIELGIFTFLNEVFHLGYWLCYLTGLVCSVLWNFTLNRKFTFHSANHIPKAMALVAAYYCVFTPGSTWLVNHMTVVWGINEYVTTVSVMILNFVTEYIFQRFVVFRGSVDSNIKSA